MTSTNVPTDFSPIEVAKLANVRPQMVYNYIKKGMQGLVAFTNDEGNLRIPADVALAWVELYTTRKAAREAAKAEQLEAELAGVTA
jgi:predicted DNA-binding protein YlxM (UPF0122 family)